jgi:hypothetical protein
MVLIGTTPTPTAKLCRRASVLCGASRTRLHRPSRALNSNFELTHQGVFRSGRRPADARPRIVGTKAWACGLPKKAKAAVARKLAQILHCKWIDATQLSWSSKEEHRHERDQGLLRSGKSLPSRNGRRRGRQIYASALTRDRDSASLISTIMRGQNPRAWREQWP